MTIRRLIPLTIVSLVAASGLAACGHNMEQRVATGAAAGAVVGGPVGAVAGAGVGAVVNETSKPK